MSDQPSMRYMGQFPVVAMYMAQTPQDCWPPPGVHPMPPTFPSDSVIYTEAPDPNRDDLIELLIAVDEYVAGKTVTEDIMHLRTKTAIIRDRMDRRGR
jgi:hypothetical protein